MIFGGEPCPPRTISSYYFDVKWELIGDPSKLYEPFQINVYLKNLYSSKVWRIKDVIIQFYPFSALSKSSTLDAMWPDFIPEHPAAYTGGLVGRCLYDESDIHLPGKEEIVFSCFYVNDFYYTDTYKINPILFFRFSTIHPYDYFQYSFLLGEIFNKEYSCFEKKIETQFWWSEKEEGEVLLSIKNNCNEKVIPEDEKGLFFEFWPGPFDIIDVLETNAKFWNNENWRIRFYYDIFLPGDEMYAKLKVKANEIPDDLKTSFELGLRCEKDLNKKISIMENKRTDIWICNRR